jgi:hypothetical protein
LAAHYLATRVAELGEKSGRDFVSCISFGMCVVQRIRNGLRELQGRLAGSPWLLAIVLEKREKAWVFGDSKWPSLVGHVAIGRTSREFAAL